MLIEQLNLICAEKKDDGYIVEVDLETSDGLSFGGQISFDQDWNYKLGFMNQFVNTDQDRYFINSVLSSEDFKRDVISYAA